MGRPTGVLVLLASATLFLLLTYFLNGQPSLTAKYYTTATSYFYPHYTSLLILSLLFGTTIAIFQYNISTAGLVEQGSAGVAGGLGVLVSGCAGCAAGILPGVFAVLGLSGSVLSLPLLGTELLLASCAIYSGLIYYLLGPAQCAVPDA